jgi:tRNA dimethylallyltransferase
VVVAGPTASGKSGLALKIASTFNGEIINCDSVQIYRHFRIGAAKLDTEGRRGIPHHLIDVAEPDHGFSAGEYSRLAREALAGITARGRLPVVAGGTGFYLRALLEGLFEGPERDDTLRARLQARETRRAGSLHRILVRLDSTAAARIHRNDVSKTIRALEVILRERRSLTELFGRGRERLEGYRVLKLGLNPPRDILYRRIDVRTQQMFEQGLVDELRSILAMGCPPAAKPLEALGYAQALRLLEGKLSREQAIAETQQATRRYAKRQWTWFRREPDMIWLDGLGDDDWVQEQAIAETRRFLAG